MKRLLLFAMIAELSLTSVQAQSFLEEVKSEPNPGKRVEIALDFAGKSLDDARADYLNGKTEQGNQLLSQIDQLVEECLSSVQEAHKHKYWKRAEMAVSALSRRVDSLLDDISWDQRDRARELRAQLENIHDKLLAGVMAK